MYLKLTAKDETPGKQAETFTLRMAERNCVEHTVSVICGKLNLEVRPGKITCGQDLTKEWCSKVAEEMISWFGLKEQEEIEISSTDVAQLKVIAKNITRIVKGSGTKSKSVDLLEDDYQLLVQYADILKAYDGAAPLSTLTIGGASITYSRLRSLVGFLQKSNGVVVQEVC